MQLPNSDLNVNPDGDELDVKMLLFKILVHWRLLVISCVIALGVAVLVNRYVTNIYRLSTLIYIKEAENPLASQNMSLMFKWGGESDLIQSHIAILKSRSHNRKVIDALELDIQYYTSGRIKMNSAYGTAPFRVVIDRAHNQILNANIKVTYVDAQHYRLEFDEEMGGEVYNYATMERDSGDLTKLTGEFVFDEWVERDAYRFKVLNQNDAPWSASNVHYFQLVYPKMIVDGLSAQLQVNEAAEGASLIEVGMQGDNKNLIVDYLNKSVELLMEYELRQKNQLGLNTIRFVDAQMQGAYDTLAAMERELEEFRSSNQIMDLGSESSALYDQYLELEGQNAAMKLQFKYYEYLVEYLSAERDFSSLMTPSVVGVEDPVVVQLVNKLVELSISRNKMSYSLEEDNPAFQQLNNEIKITTQNLKENVLNLVEASKIQQQELNNRLQSLRSKFASLPLAEQNLINIKRKYDLSAQQYQFLIEKRAEAELSMAGNLPDLQVIDPAEDYNDLPIKPKKLLNYVIALLLGLIVPIGYIFGKDFFATKLTSKTDLEKATKIPVIGTVGHSSGASNIVIQNGLKSGVAESFRVIRTNLNFIFKQRKDQDNSKAKMILVTSSIGGEGKTFTAINLSAILAVGGAKTVIVGLDMRKPKIFNDFNLDNAVGLSNYLSGQVSKEDVVKKTNVENLDFVTAGPVPPNPSELLLNEELPQLFEYLKEQYDYVILDTPPIALVSDALELIRYADASLYIARQNYTHRDLLHVINDQYAAGNVSNISIVFNDVVKSQYGYGYNYGYSYGYNYGYGYGYYEDDEEKLPWWRKIV